MGPYISEHINLVKEVIHEIWYVVWGFGWQHLFFNIQKFFHGF